MDTHFRGKACPVLQLRAPRLTLALECGRLDVQDHLVAFRAAAAYGRRGVLGPAASLGPVVGFSVRRASALGIRRASALGIRRASALGNRHASALGIRRVLSLPTAHTPKPHR